MKNILTMICVIDWLANDLHYKSTGNGFYEKHLLADRIRDFGDAEDQIKENYYLGFKLCLPPQDSDIAKSAIVAYDKICAQSEYTLERLEFAFKILRQQVEICKSEAGLPGGIHAILDDVSNKALTYGFLTRSESGTAPDPCID